VTERTPEQIAADNAIEDALALAVKAYELTEDGDVVTTWAILGASQGLDDARTGYFQLYPSGSQPTHITVGLLRMAEAQILHGYADDE
jgi:hypothetical protein